MGTLISILPCLGLGNKGAVLTSPLYGPRLRKKHGIINTSSKK